MDFGMDSFSTEDGFHHDISLKFEQVLIDHGEHQRMFSSDYCDSSHTRQFHSTVIIINQMHYLPFAIPIDSLFSIVVLNRGTEVLLLLRALRYPSSRLPNDIQM